jgi:trk system potassium uptake protein TrkH
VLTAAVLSATSGRRAVTAFGRELPTFEVTRALSVALLALALIFVATLILTVTEPFSLTALMFEATSAFGTVGLSTGITPDLSVAGKLLITVLMYIGRIGPLTLALALAQRSRAEPYKYPEAHVKIG